MSEYYFTPSHECFTLTDGIAVVSITEHAVEQLGEITFVQLPTTGQRFERGTPFGEIESIKTVASLYAPVTGTVLEVNSTLESQPELVNDDTLGKGWLIKLRAENPAEAESLMNREAYLAYLEGSS
jgi:glycine cleavage system H protein